MDLLRRLLILGGPSIRPPLISATNGLLPLSDFWGHENSTIISITIPSITKKNATGEVPFALSVNSSATSCVGTRNKSVLASNPQIDLDTRWTLTHLGGAAISFKSDPLMIDSNGVSINPYTQQFGNGARFLIREAGQYTLTQTSKGDDGSGGFITTTFSETITVAANTQSHRFIDGISGNDANDGLDPHGFAITAGSYVSATRTLTKTGAFASLTLDNEYPQFSANYIHISGTGITTGLYEIESKHGNNSIVLKLSAGSDSSDVASSDGPKQTFDNIAVSGEMTHIKGGQVYLVDNEWGANGRANSCGAVGYSGVAEIKANSAFGDMYTFFSNFSGSLPAQTYIGNVDYNGNSLSQYIIGGAAGADVSFDSTLTTTIFDHVLAKNAGGVAAVVLQSTKITKPVDNEYWNFEVQNKRIKRKTVIAAADWNFVQANSGGVAYTGWSGAGSSAVTIDYTADAGIFDSLVIDDQIYIKHSITTANSKTWVVIGNPTANTIAVSVADGSDAFNAVAEASTQYNIGSVTVTSVPAGTEASGELEMPTSDVRGTIPIPFSKITGNRFHLVLFNRVLENYLRVDYLSGASLVAAEAKAQGMFTNSVETDAWEGAVGIKIATDSLLKVFEHSWYPNGYGSNFCVSCIETDASPWVGYALNLNASGSGNKRPLTSITNFNFGGGSHGVDASNSNNSSTDSEFGDLFIARGLARIHESFVYLHNAERVRLKGVNHSSIEPNNKLYHMGLGVTADPAAYNVAISKCNVFGAELLDYDCTSSIEAWDNTIHSDSASAFGVDIRPASDDPAAHQLVYDNELYLPNAGGTPYKVDGSGVSLSALNTLAGGGNTNQNPNFIDPVNGDYTKVVLVPVLASLVLPQGDVGETYSFFVSGIQTSGSIADSWALESGSMGNGLSFNPTTSEISGSPLAAVSLVGLSFSATNAGGASNTTNIDDLVSALFIPQTLNFSSNQYLSITEVPLAIGDTASIRVTATSAANDRYVMSGRVNNAQVGNALSIASSDIVGFINGTLTIDGNNVVSGSNIAAYLDDIEHVWIFTATTPCSITRIGRIWSGSTYMTDGSMRDLTFNTVANGVTTYNINSGSITVGTADVGAGFMTFNNTIPQSWS